MASDWSSIRLDWSRTRARRRLARRQWLRRVSLRHPTRALGYTTAGSDQFVDDASISVVVASNASPVKRSVEPVGHVYERLVRVAHGVEQCVADYLHWDEPDRDPEVALQCSRSRWNRLAFGITAGDNDNDNNDDDDDEQQREWVHLALLRQVPTYAAWYFSDDDDDDDAAGGDADDLEDDDGPRLKHVTPSHEAMDGDDDDDDTPGFANAAEAEWARAAEERRRAKQEKQALAPSAQESDHYAVLGLSELRWRATEKDIRNAYRRLILEYHPDKNSDVSDEVFKRIQRAHEVLSDLKLRRAFDSTDQAVDDSIPPASFEPKTDDEFFRVFGECFERNARWSLQQPVPKLGTNETAYQDVVRFYNFWADFKTWRTHEELNEFDESDLEMAQFREERRWMERRNATLQAGARKKERQRLNNLIDRAQKLDPRLRRHREELIARRQAAKDARKQERRRLAMEAQERARAFAEEQARVAAQKEEERVAARKAAQNEKRALGKRRNRVRALLASLPDQTAVRRALSGANDDGASGDGLDDDDDNSNVIEFLDVNELQLLLAFKQQQQTGWQSQLLDQLAKLCHEARQRNAVELEEQRKAQAERRKQENAAAAWTDEELSLLAKGVARFPGGQKNRWECIRDMLHRKRSIKDIIAKTKEIEATVDARRLKDRETLLAKQESLKNAEILAQPGGNSATDESLDKRSNDTKGGGESTGAQSASVVDGSSADGWSADEQKLLEVALVKFPAALGKERWTHISKHVGRSRKQCVERYKYCVSLLKNKTS